ncbi:MAG TPA: MCE family protein [Sporichthya sp.]|nr:MCE family protein [Sporichthya sp.]
MKAVPPRFLLRFLPRTPRATGIATVAVLAVLAGMLFVPSGVALGKSTYYAELARAGGLAAGDEVRIAGIGVGQVTSLKIRDAKVRVSFRVGDSVRLGQDTRADVKIATLLGTHYLGLTPAGEGPLPNHTIPVAQTTVPFEIQDIVEAGAPALEQLDGVRLRQALRVIADGFRDTPALARQAVGNIARLSDVVLTRRDQLDRLIAQTAAVTANLDSNRDALVDLLEQASAIFHEISVRRAVIRELLQDTRALARALSGVISDNQQKIQPLLRNLNVVLDTLRANADALERIAILLGPAARYFGNAAGNGPYVDANGPNAVLPDSLLCKGQSTC